MPTKKNREGHPDHKVPTLADAGIGGGQRKHGSGPPIQAVQHNIRNGGGGKAAKGNGLLSHGEHDVKTRVSFGGGKREKPKMTQKLAN
jgi:hypothetical protein